MGFPPRAWFDVERLARGYTAVWSTLADNLVRLDPTYFEDFWTVPGYLGAHPPASLEQARIQHKTTVTGVVFAEEAAALGLPMPMAMARGTRTDDIPVAVRLAEVPEGNLMGAMLRIVGGPAAGRVMHIVGVQAGLVLTGVGEAHFEGRGRAGRGPRGGGRQLGVPGLPDLPPPPGRPRLPRLGPVHRGRPPDLPAAAERDRPVLRPPGLGLDQDRPVRREDDRGPDPDGRGRVPVAGRLVPRQGRGGARRRVARRPLPALVRRPRHAHRRRPVAGDGHARHVAGPQDPHGQLPGRAAAGAARRRRLGRARPGSAGEHRVRPGRRPGARAAHRRGPAGRPGRGRPDRQRRSPGRGRGGPAGELPRARRGPARRGHGRRRPVGLRGHRRVPAGRARASTGRGPRSTSPPPTPSPRRARTSPRCGSPPSARATWPRGTPGSTTWGGCGWSSGASPRGRGRPGRRRRSCRR